MGKYDPGEIPIRQASVGHLKGVKDCPGGMGKLIIHGLGRIEDIVLPTGILNRETGKFAVQGHGPKDPMKRKLILPGEVDPIGGQRRKGALTGKGVAFVHAVTWRHFHIEIFPPFLFKGLEQP
jgi:hypothetical protein